VFNKLPSQVVVTWSTMILGHVKCRQGQKALELFQQMKQEGVWPNSVGSRLVDMCAKCRNIEDTWIVFDKMPS
jgi:pentatricopeptide repeat protein